MRARGHIASLLVSLLLGTLLLSGCQHLYEKSEENDREWYRTEVHTAWKKATGENARSLRDVPQAEMSESHQVMASMILSGNGMETDLSKYRSVYLVEFEDGKGVERAAVVADGKVVLPKNIE